MIPFACSYRYIAIILVVDSHFAVQIFSTRIYSTSAKFEYCQKLVNFQILNNTKDTFTFKNKHPLLLLLLLFFFIIIYEKRKTKMKNKGKYTKL